MTKSPKELAAELRALGEKATPGRWSLHYTPDRRSYWIAAEEGYVANLVSELPAPDGRLIEAYRNHHATILASLEDAGEVEGLRKALQPFADACAKADASSEEVRRAGMGNGHSDEATPGWGIRYKHLKEARRALGSAKETLTASTDGGQKNDNG